MLSSNKKCESKVIEFTKIRLIYWQIENGGIWMRDLWNPLATVGHSCPHSWPQLATAVHTVGHSCPQLSSQLSTVGYTAAYGWEVGGREADFELAQPVNFDSAPRRYRSLWSHRIPACFLWPAYQSTQHTVTHSCPQLSTFYLNWRMDPRWGHSHCRFGPLGNYSTIAQRNEAKWNYWKSQRNQATTPSKHCRGGNRNHRRDADHDKPRRYLPSPNHSHSNHSHSNHSHSKQKITNQDGNASFLRKPIYTACF